MVAILGTDTAAAYRIARELMEAGQSVFGLVRSMEKGEALAAAGGTVMVGSLGDLNVLRQGATDADGIVHTAFGLDISRINELAAEDKVAIETFGEVFAGSARLIIVTDGFLHLTGEKAKETDRPEAMPAYCPPGPTPFRKGTVGKGDGQPRKPYRSW